MTKKCSHGPAKQPSIINDFKSIQKDLVLFIILAIGIYILKTDIMWVMLVYGLALCFRPCTHSGLLLADYRYPYSKEPAHWFILEWFIRGIGWAMVVYVFTSWCDWSRLSIVSCTTGGLLYGYAMNFYESIFNMKNCELLRGIGIGLVVLGLSYNFGVTLIPTICLTFGSFLVGYFMPIK